MYAPDIFNKFTITFYTSMLISTKQEYLIDIIREYLWEKENWDSIELSMDPLKPNNEETIICVLGTFAGKSYKHEYTLRDICTDMAHYLIAKGIK